MPSELSHLGPASRPRVVSYDRGFPVRKGDMGIPSDKFGEGQRKSLPFYTEPLLYFQFFDIPHLREVFDFFFMLSSFVIPRTEMSNFDWIKYLKYLKNDGN